MSADLIFRLQKVVALEAVLEKTRNVLLDMLKVESTPALICELPPRLKGSEIKLEERSIDSSFPGAYIRFQDNEESVVDFQVFEGSQQKLLVGCGGVQTAASEVLTAALAAASAQLMGALIVDAGLHWTDKEESRADELIKRLALQEHQSDFNAAIELVHRNQFGHTR